MKRIRIYVYLLILFVITAFVTIEISSWSKSSSDSISISGPQNISMLVLLAEEKGFFSAHKVKVKYNPLQNGTLTFDAVASNRTDIGILVDANLAFIGFEGLHGVTAIASIMEKTDDGIVARSGSGISSAADLSGKRLGYLPGTSSDVFLRSLAFEKQLDLANVTLVPMSPPAMVAGIVNGDLDAISIWQPFQILAMESLGNGGVEIENNGIYKAKVFLTVRKDKISDHIESLSQVILALIDAQAYAHEHAEESIDFLSAAIGVERSALAKSWSQYNFNVDLDGNIVSDLSALGQRIVQTDRDFDGKPIPNYRDAVTVEVLDRVRLQRSGR